jgi:hypothetical protein
MKINNLETGLRKTLVAAFRSKGLSKTAADAKASKHLKAATTHFNAQLTERATVKAISRPAVAELAAAPTGRAKLALARDLFDSRKASSSSDSPQTVRAALRSVAAWAKTR